MCVCGHTHHRTKCARLDESAAAVTDAASHSPCHVTLPGDVARIQGIGRALCLCHNTRDVLSLGRISEIIENTGDVHHVGEPHDTCVCALQTLMTGFLWIRSKSISPKTKACTLFTLSDLSDLPVIDENLGPPDLGVTVTFYLVKLGP